MKCPKCDHVFDAGQKADKGNPKEAQQAANLGSKNTMIGSKAAKMASSGKGK